ncbi:phytoene desaturase family protein [Halodesulfovibrio spirochaetisodalis]|uniref:Amine oxidase domain-containing protein n=1 Tax=Halodesulfovibrio spirochaetisodalis TaxID=1560234 RepID=A0A1B7XBJ0_9BACT|nr:NAD(P)/FAD-dependent oxidoreductase [Halodesulfovibrio spirochaetisodalis]OBQ50118.1 hypothetical protein SP90_10785 [Halodesulfovibrio spirochaetisodalis]
MRCVVIGSGCAGLTSALIMAKNGYDVTVVEKSHRPAPLLQGFQRKGFYFDTGLHCLSGLNDGEPLRVLLDYLGLSSWLTYVPFAEDSSFTVHFPDNVVWQMPQGYEELERSLCTLFPNEQAGIRNFLKKVRPISLAFQYTADFQAIASAPLANRSLKEVLDEHISEPKVKTCLGILNNLFCGLQDYETPFGFFASSIGTYFNGSGTFKGGGTALFEALRTELNAAGCEIIYDNGVTEVLVDNNRTAVGVRLTDGTELASDMLIATCHPASLLEIVPQNCLRNIRRTYYKELESTTSLVGVYGYSSIPVKELQHGNVALATECYDPDSTSSTLEQRQMLVTSNRTESGETGISILVPSSYSEWAQFEGEKPHQRQKGYSAEKKSVAKRIVAAASRALPQLAENFTVLSISTPLTIKDYCCAPEGTAYGVKRSLQQLSPTAAFPIKNMVLSGQAIVGPGILGAMTAGFVSCGEILGHTYLQNEMKKCS